MLDAFIKARPAILVRPDKAHEIRRHNVPRHRTFHYGLALLDWRRSLALHLVLGVLRSARGCRDPAVQSHCWHSEIAAGCIELTGNG